MSEKEEEYSEKSQSEEEERQKKSKKKKGKSTNKNKGNYDAGTISEVGYQQGNYQMQPQNNQYSNPVMYADPNQQMMMQQMPQQQMMMQQPMMVQQQPVMMVPQQQMMVQQPMMMVPQMPAGMIVYGGMQLMQVGDPLAELLNYPSVSINQKFELIEVLTGCETPNEYIVIGESGGYQQLLFNIREHASCECLTCCPGKYRELSLDLNSVAMADPTGGFSRTNLASYYKECTFGKVMCPICCRQDMVQLNGGTDLQSAKSSIRVMDNPFTFCDFQVNVLGDAGEVIYTLDADCCQCGIFCKKLCGKCTEVDFNIFKGDTKEIVGNIHKKFNCASVFTDQDFYQLTFPPDCTVENRIKLIFATVFIDYLYYEDNSDKEESSGRRRRGGYGRRYGGRRHRY
ncbi:MAG: hypothetical protein MJ252_31205 [archaeon]|nr:hypothetical protein [archaeon]